MSATVKLIVPAAIGLATQLIQIYFELMRAAGRTPEQVDEHYMTERVKFYANHPDTLPDA